MGEYNPWDADWVHTINWNGRVTEDIRSVIQQQDVSTDDKGGKQLFRSRFLDRNATGLGKGYRSTATSNR